uniref:RHS repeat-associated core domain-containing protein n=1 Tax=Microvirgula aerodenitrificans TaxID=57480 RepID=UPI0028E61DC8
PLPFAQHYRDATRKPVLVRKADSDEQRRRFTPWYACALDENDTYLGTAKPLENLQRSFDSTRRPQIGMHGEPINWVGPKMQLYDLGGGARSYDPDIQRFLTLDPFSPFSIGGMNPYLFCSSDPVNRLDPTGYVSYRMGSYGYSASAAIYAGITGLIAGVLSILSILTMTGLILMVITLVGSLLLVVAASMQIASGVIIESDPEYGAELGDASNVLYSISGALLIIPAANSAWGGILKIKNSTWRITQCWRNNANYFFKKLSIGSQNASFPPPRPRLARSLSASNPELGNPIVSACPKLYATLPRSPSKSIKSVSEDSIYYSTKTSIADSLSMTVRSFIKLP